ncbi:hypothetical protein NP493_5642g00008 [Ridgeia piscesae]|uniref:Uncharacterized protein n=1 Tax=Ridgeia piscesae TaxID=27915 RepID=A0AAD9MR26_RIDPI|nr:hypothetical protein NP493_5642g00008 [Ridgeia piscesae]
MCLDYEKNYLSLQPGGIGRSLVFLQPKAIYTSSFCS